MTKPLQRLRQFLAELRRRNVYQVAATYAVVGFVLIQVADLTFVRLGLPSWTVTFVIVLVATGFPLALVLAWAFERTPDGMAVVAADSGRILFANRAAEALFGRSSQELVGGEFGHPLVAEESTEIDVVRGGDTVVVELRVVETEWEGQEALIVSLRDVTDRKEAEERKRELLREQVARAEAEDAARRAEILAEAGRRLASSIALDETLQNTVNFMADEFADYCILDLVEPEGTRRFGATHDGHVIDQHLRIALEQPLDPGADTPQARVFRSHEPTLVRNVDEDWLQAAAQNDEHLDIMRKLGLRTLIMVPLFTGRECLGLLSVAGTSEETSFTERDLHLAAELGRRAALAIENARLYRNAEAANEAKTNFLSVMSHELRTPLSAIIGYADLLDRGVAGEVTDQQSQYLGRIRASSNHLLQIIEEILAFAGADAGKESSHPEETTLQELVEGVYLASSNYKLTGMPFWCCVAWVELALLDLLGNANRRRMATSIRAMERSAVFIVPTMWRLSGTPKASPE